LGASNVIAVLNQREFNIGCLVSDSNGCNSR